MQGIVEKSNKWTRQDSERRHRLHEILLALIRQQVDMELIDAESPPFDGNFAIDKTGQDPARWLERNSRILKKYQSLVRSAITLDALLDSEQFETTGNTNH